MAAAQDAQDAPVAEEGASEGDEIIVTGIRETIQTSIETKRRETAIVDALSSDDIGDLPALSVGQAIQTITGATTHREKGDASEIAIRGLGPFLSNATFNGRDASNGSGDRAVNFNQFPSELINNIKIYKTQQANLVEGGVAGTIELETLRPLDFNRTRIQAELKGNYNPYGERIGTDDPFGYRATLSYVDQFETGLGRIGISLGAQRNETSNPEETLAASTTWVACDATQTVTGNCPEVDRGEDTPFYLAPNAITFRQIVEHDRRDALFGAIQWQPSDTLDINIDAQYSNRDFSEERHDLNLSEGRYSISNRVINEEGRFLESYSGVSSLESTSTLLERGEEYLGGGIDIAWEATDRLTLSADASYSGTKRVEIERSTRLRSDPLDIYGNRTPLNNQRVPYTYTIENGYAPTITFDPRFDITNHDLFSDDARIRRDQTQRENEIWAGRFDVNYQLDGGFLSQIDAGARYTKLTYEDFDDRVEITQNDRNVDRDVNLACRTVFPQRDFLSDAPGNSISSWATFDPICLFRGYLGTEDPGGNEDVRDPANRDVEENTWAGYVMASYDSTLGDMPVRGNFGVRVVNTHVTSRGLRADLEVDVDPDTGAITLEPVDDSFVGVTIENETTRFLPSINAIFELDRNLLLRLAGYRAMSRPAPSSLGAGRTIRLDDGEAFTTIEEAIDGIDANGSPRLEPLMSWNADAALEYYPNPDTILSGTVYYKKFTGGFIPVRIDEDFVIGGETVTIPVTQTRNSDDQSRIYGFELTLANRFTWLPAPFDGLGGKVSYNYADSDFETQDIDLGDVVDLDTGEVTQGLIPPANISGYSKHVLSAQAYYDAGPVSLQGIFNYRSGYYQDFVGGNNQLRYVRDNETFDLRATYQVNRNISLRAEALNIFNEPKITDMPVKGSIRQYHYYGSKYFLSVRVRI
ncbi:TonB-dependent receptor [Sphingomonas gilva]|uniref:TonB-dependent receptor n=2 Tax=Sphingomonas gilva TaxID=2305907 RepID=A0A396RT75_9SPHN|nr:TonB-dependent receptor [Sphingomonas gilva]